MKKNELKDLNERLKSDLHHSQKECEKLREALKAAEYQAKVLYSGKDELEDKYLAIRNAYRALNKEYEDYKIKTEIEAKSYDLLRSFSPLFLGTIRLIRDQKEEYIALFSKMQRAHLFSIMECQVPPESLEAMLENVGDLFENI